MKPITPSDYPNLKHFFKQQRYELCVYSLPSILVWTSKIYQPCGVITDHETLIVGIEYNAVHADKRHLLLPISPAREFSPEELRNFAVSLGFEDFYFVPADYMEKFGQQQVEAFFEIKEQPDLYDYIYLREDLAELKGSRYSKKRNLISQFKREYPDNVTFEKLTASTVSECADFLEKWCEERNCDENTEGEGLSCEKQAVMNAFENIEVLEMNGILLRIDGVVSAFGIASRLTENMGALHFQKAFAHIKGLYQFFDNLCAKHMFQGYQYINKESDMGIPGLARSKMSYFPVTILKSYKLTVR